MFNPTMIRVCTYGAQIGVVIAPSLASDYNYFQVYTMRPNDGTYLRASTPFKAQVDALQAFEMWVSSMEAGATYPLGERTEPHITL